MYSEPCSATGMISGSALLRSCDQPVQIINKRPRVQDQVQLLCEMVERVEKAVSELGETLKPITTPFPGSCLTKDSSNATPMSPLYLELNAMQDRLYSLERTIYDLKSSVQL